MDVARGSIDRPIYTCIIMLICLLGGIWGFANLGRLEDPAFTIKTAVDVTQYPGASAEEVSREVTEPLESAIQKMGCRVALNCEMRDSTKSTAVLCP